MRTIYNGEVNSALYLRSLVNQVYKILPLKEAQEPTLSEYLRGLQCELTGFSSLVEAIGSDPMYITIMSVIEYMLNHQDDMETISVRREVFRCISLINKLEVKYN